MGIWDRVRGIAKKPKRQGTGFELSRWQQPPPRRGTIQLLAAYREMPWLRAVVEKIADNVAGVSWRVYKRVDGNGTSVRDFSLRTANKALRSQRMKVLASSGQLIEVPDHAALRVLSDPNDHITGRAATKLFSIHLELVGDTFLVLERKSGVVVGFWPVPPSWVIRLPRLDVAPRDRTYGITVAGQSRDVPASDVIHMRNHDPEDPLARGIGPGFALGDELDSDEYAAKFIKSYFFNQAVPAAVIAIENMPSGDTAQAKSFKESLFANHQGPDNAGKVMITGGKTTISRLDTTFRDMEMVHLREFLKDFIRQVYGIPPEVLGDVTSSNRATAQAAQSILAEQVTTPRLEMLRTELQLRLMREFGDDAILDYDSPIPADREHELKVATAAPWSRSVNEWRDLQGLPALPEFEGVFPPLSMPGQAAPGKPGEAPPADDAQADPEMPAPAEKLFAESARDPVWATRPLKLGH